MKAAIYARFSSDKQNARSADDQVALCREICAREKLIVAAVYDDPAVSGASIHNRLGLQRLLRDARAGQFQFLVVEDLDRLSRSQADMAFVYERLQFCGVQIRTAHDGLTDDIHVGVKGLLSARYLKDLAQKTRRGQAGVVADGRHNGGRSYGYRPVAGRPGELEIDEREAAIVRRIFESYLTRSARDIAGELNAAKVPGPRGGAWNASTISGSRKRANGILSNELYAGRIVWNRQTFLKDPDTGKRVSRENPREQWVSAEAPQLRIVDDGLWQKVRARRAHRGREQVRWQATRPMHLLSGLVRCHACGTGYTTSGSHGSRGPLLRCARQRETGLCDNRFSIARSEIEERVLKAIETQLAAPELIAAYVKEYRRAMRELAGSRSAQRSVLEKNLAKTMAAIKKTIDTLIHGRPSRGLRETLDQLESERDAIEAELAQTKPPALELHPNAADVYREKIRDLKATLASSDQDSRAAATAQIRQIIEKVIVHPRQGKAADLELHGQLAAFLSLSEQGKNAGAGVVVAGAGFCHALTAPALIFTDRSAL